jgi:hypothetical protein
MIPILSFTHSELSREIVRLGNAIIGEITPYNGREATAAYLLRLPDGLTTRFQPVSSMQAARRRVVAEVSEWLLLAGVFYPGQLIEFELRNRRGELVEAGE